MEYEVKNDNHMTKLKNAANYNVRQADIIDTDAQNYGELKKSYLGQYAALCTICNQLVYIPTKDLTQIEKCPYCGFKECFVLEGKLGSAEVEEGEAEKEHPLYDDVYGVKMTEGLDSYVRRKLNS